MNGDHESCDGRPMTVVGIMNSPDALYMIADAIRGRPIGSSTTEECEFDTKKDKILRLGDDYVTVVGDAMVLNAAYTISTWVDPSPPDFGNRDVFDRVLAVANAMRRIHISKNRPVMRRQGATLLACCSSRAMFWRAEQEGNELVRKGDSPTLVEEGRTLICYGGRPIALSNSVGGHEARDWLKGQIRKTDCEARERDEGPLPYPLGDDWSEVLIRKDRSLSSRLRRQLSSLGCCLATTSRNRTVISRFRPFKDEFEELEHDFEATEELLVKGMKKAR